MSEPASENEAPRGKPMRNFLFGLIFGWISLTAVYQFHLVRNEDGFMVVPKQTASVASTYADTREWTALDWSNHPQLKQSMSAHGHSVLVPYLPDLPNLDLPQEWWKWWESK